MSGYQMYSKHVHAELKKKTDQKIALPVVSKYISTEWGKLSGEEKQEWKLKAQDHLNEQQKISEAQVDTKPVEEEEDFEIEVKKRKRTPSISEDDSDSEPVKKSKSKSSS